MAIYNKFDKINMDFFSIDNENNELFQWEEYSLDELNVIELPSENELKEIENTGTTISLKKRY